LLIKLLGEAGFEGVELQRELIAEYAKEAGLGGLKSLLAESNVAPAGVMAFPFKPFGDRTQELAAVEENADVAARLGTSTLLCFIGEAPPDEADREQRMQLAGDAARQYGEAASRHGCSIALEPIGAAAFMSTPEEALEIASRSGCDNVGIMMDTFHYFKSRVGADRVRQIPVDKLLIVHINDCEDRPLEELGDHHRVYCGSGILPLGEYLGALKDIGYDGYLSVELFNRAYWEDDPANVIRQAKEGLDSVLAGL